MGHLRTGIGPGGQDVSGHVHSVSKEHTFRGAHAFRGGESLDGTGRLVDAAARLPTSLAH